MKKLRKIVAILLATLMLFSLACAEGNAALKKGVLHTEALSEAMNKWREDHDIPLGSGRIQYDNLTAALMDLSSGKISGISTELSTAEYVVARNDNFGMESHIATQGKTQFSMLVMENNQEVYDIINNAIVAMKADGTLDSLIENELKVYIESDPAPVELPVFEGAKTIKVGVTGDLPPMDFVAANGKAAGFNVALLSEIANRAQVNFELVQIETGARAIALASGKVDAVFWTKNLICEHCDKAYEEGIAGTLSTESYFVDGAVIIVLKQQ